MAEPDEPGGATGPGAIRGGDRLAVEERLREFIVTDLGWGGPAQELTSDFSLIDHQVLDSLDLFSLVAFLLAHYGVDVPAEALVASNFENLAAIASFVVSQPMHQHASLPSRPGGVDH